MKCHYELCQEPALSTWPISMSEVPLCAEHADWMTEAVPLPNVSADPAAEHDKMVKNITAAMEHIRNDYEWSAEAYERDPGRN